MNDMVDEGTGLTRPQALAYFEKLVQLTMGYLSQGYFVSTPLFRFRASLPGTFASKNDHFDPSMHEIKYTASAGLRIRKMPPYTMPAKFNISKISPELFYFIDSTTEEINSVGTSGKSAKIEGVNLKFDKTDEHQGVFFKSVADPDLEVRVSVYTEIKPSAIYFNIPDIEPGEYRIIVRSLTPNKLETVTGTLAPSVMF